MQVTIIPQDNSVVLDGAALRIDCSGVAPMIHAIQWNDEAGEGQIEFVQTPGKPFMPNVKIVEFGGYEYLRQAYVQRRTQIAAAQAAAVAAKQAADAAFATMIGEAPAHNAVLAEKSSSDAARAFATAAIEGLVHNVNETRVAADAATRLVNALINDPGHVI